jgi:hypothetical protein
MENRDCEGELGIELGGMVGIRGLECSKSGEGEEVSGGGREGIVLAVVDERGIIGGSA